MRIDIAIHKLGAVIVDKILCNGFVQKFVTVADDEMGFVERLKTDKKGQILTIGDSACKEIVSGRVQIVFKKHWSVSPDGKYFVYQNGTNRILYDKEVATKHLR